jgi:hypothetical protein
MANTLKLHCNGAVGFVDWLGRPMLRIRENSKQLMVCAPSTMHDLTPVCLR